METRASENPESCRRSFQGTVFSGIGHGSFYVSIYAKQFRIALGINPYPGTLNVRLEDEDARVLNSCLKSIGGILIRPPEIPGSKLGAVYAFPSVISGIESFIVRPVITVYKSDVVEFISETYLRGALNLRDGDTVEFKVKL